MVHQKENNNNSSSQVIPTAMASPDHHIALESKVHLPGARFQTKKVTIEYQNTQNGDTHVNLDLVNCRNNPSPRITTYGNIKTIHLWIRLTVIRIESWHKIIYPSQQRAAVRSKKRARPATDLTRPVPITLSPIQMLSISAFLKANEFATRLPLV